VVRLKLSGWVSIGNGGVNPTVACQDFMENRTDFFDRHCIIVAVGRSEIGELEMFKLGVMEMKYKGSICYVLVGAQIYVLAMLPWIA